MGAGTAILVVALVAVVLLILVSRARRGEEMLEDWATSNGYRIIERHYRLFDHGPFFWSSRGQVVYEVTVEDEAARPRRGWVRLGSYLWGLGTEKAEVVWDEWSWPATRGE